MKTFVEGTPKAQPRHRTTKDGHVFTPDSAEGWRQRIAAALVPVRPPEPHLGPVHLACSFVFERPRKHFRANGDIKDRFHDDRHIQKPDLDNLVKSLKDEMQQMGIMRNDSQVWRLAAEKIWCGKGERPGLHLIVELEKS